MKHIDPDGHSFFKKLFNAFKQSIGSFLGAIVGGTIGFIVGGPIGMFIGANIGAGIGQSIQHGGNVLTNIGNSFVSSLQNLAVAAAGFAVGGPVGAFVAVVGYNMGTTLANGGSFEDALVSGVVTTTYMVVGAAYYKAVGKIMASIEERTAQKAGVQKPIGEEKNTTENLNTNKGKQASNEQSLNLRKTKVINDREYTYRDEGFGLKNYDKINGEVRRFFNNYDNRNGFNGGMVEDGNSIQMFKSLPGSKGDGSHTVWYQRIDNDGNVVSLFHDTYSGSGQYLHTGAKVPGPGRHVYPDGTVKFD